MHAERNFGGDNSAKLIIFVARNGDNVLAIMTYARVYNDGKPQRIVNADESSPRGEGVYINAFV